MLHTSAIGQWAAPRTNLTKRPSRYAYQSFYHCNRSIRAAYLGEDQRRNLLLDEQLGALAAQRGLRRVGLCVQARLPTVHGQVEEQQEVLGRLKGCTHAVARFLYIHLIHLFDGKGLMEEVCDST